MQLDVAVSAQDMKKICAGNEIRPMASQILR